MIVVYVFVYIEVHCTPNVFPLPVHTVVIDAYPNTATVEQGTTGILVCRVVGVPSATVLSYQWTCPEGSCDAGAVDPEWAAKVQQGNILVVNVRNGNDAGDYTCTVMDSSTPLVSRTHSVTVTSELSFLVTCIYIASRYTPACKVTIVVAILYCVNKNGGTSSIIRIWSLAVIDLW